MEIKWTRTDRGFALGEFSDRHDQACEIAKSSLAEEDCIWLGIRDANPMVMASQADRHGIETDKTTGWVPYPIPDDVLLRTSIHMTRDMAKTLIPILQHFVKTGQLPHPDGIDG